MTADPSAGPSDPRRSVRERVFVLGAGIMGGGIAAECALHGFAVTLEDVTEELVRRGQAGVERMLSGAVDHGAIGAADRTEALRNIELAIGLRRVDSADLILEAVPEQLELKR
ncbi:MAG TPA: 3-hydroxyacyl-CoA dehydrogenase NAD-binding domain-containing protein, partial [Thermoplasmata archaeon]|nr:3-hydroxyacyl-CoA dehydrogenase NAD-binding domain-containing protein [Thermoplasmata archaeon]